MKKKIYCLFVVLCLVLTVFFTTIPIAAESAASSETYSTVLSDLHKDPDFDQNDYPGDIDDNTVSVIQIAESLENELFVYVYQPADDFYDIVVREISLYDNFSPDPVDRRDPDVSYYDLELVSTSGVFDKYLVKDYTVSDEAYRYYNIVGLYTDVIAGFNDMIGGVVGGTVNYAGYSVGQQWCLYWYNDVLYYEMNTFDFVSLDIKHSGTIDVSSGVNIFGGYYDEDDYINYVCFDFAREQGYYAEHIYDATVTYDLYSYYLESYLYDFSPEPEEEVLYNQKVKLTDTAVHTFESDYGLFTREYKWNEIQNSADFLSQIDEQGIELIDESKNAIRNSQWVFCFLVTEEWSNVLGDWTYISKQWVENVNIIQIHFLNFDGKIYNLGAVTRYTATPDDVVDGAGGPSSVGVVLDNTLKKIENFVNKLISDGTSVFEKILQVVLLFVGVVIILVLIPSLLPLLLKIIIFVFKLLFKIISAPFRLIDKGRGKKP